MKMFPAGTLPLKNRRGTPTRLLNKGRPAAKVAHFRAPLKGLSRYAEIGEADPLLASILTNWVVEDDRITVRPGYKLVADTQVGLPISTLIPFYGEPSTLIAACGHRLFGLDGLMVGDDAIPFGSDDWAWTSFSNLSSIDYTIMVNGVDGVISWDGGKLAASFVRETIAVPTGETWINPLKFDKVVSHMNRLWFADSQNLAVYYLPIQQKNTDAGTTPPQVLGLFPLSVLFKRGGHIQAMHTWSLDGGAGLDDVLVIFSSNGEAVIYKGVDPESDFSLVGIFRFDAPMSKDSIINFGGDLYVMISSGFVPLTTMIRAETEQLGKSDLNVMKEFEEIAKNYRASPGWQVILNQHTNHAICNMPLGDGQYQQMVRKMPGQIWMKWASVPARCWGWLNNHTYFGSEDGKIYLGGSEYLSDDGKAIDVDVRFAWSSYKSASKKNFKLARLYTITDGQPRPFIDVEVDYNNQPPINQPEVGLSSAGADWNTATWNVDYWSLPVHTQNDWQGVTGLGRVGAPRIRASILDCSYSLTGVDILYELGGVM